LIFIGLLSLVLGSASVSWAQIVVTTLADSGPGSLRQAVIDANADRVATTIIFDPAVFPPPPALPGVILLQSPLPNLTGIRGDTIDGTGAGVVLDGSALAAGSIGLNVRGSNYTIRGLTIQNMPSDGIRVETPPPGSVVVSVTGVLITGNRLNQNGSRGIRVLGGTGPGKTVSAFITNNTVTDNLVAGITVSANSGDIGSGDPGGNQVDVTIDGNFVSGAVLAGLSGGSGISIAGGIGDGSDNVVTALISNNTVDQNTDEGISAVGCGIQDAGSNNRVTVTIVNNLVTNNGLDPVDASEGIVVVGAAGDAGTSTTCVGNVMRFDISHNTVTGSKTRNISVSGGTGTEHDVQGVILSNIANNSRENVGILVSGGGGSNNDVHDILIRENEANANGANVPASGDGIQVGGGSGVANTVRNITVTRNETRDNYDEGISITGASGTGNIVTGIEISHNNAGANLDQGIEVSGGSGQGNQVSDILITNNTATRNGNRGIRLTVGTGTDNAASVRTITSNNSNNNGTDGIGIGTNVPGSGNTLIFRNRTNANGQDGIDIDSVGYVVRSNVANANTVDGINAVGNTNGGRNVANSNASCNAPGCF
jgi:hypothetical protein